tara:strand:+ start:65 stop:355 length:291 start_codon:yes stop_codon:yes gene_type:complete
VNKSSCTKIYIAQNLTEKTGFSVQFSYKLINDFVGILIESISNNKFNLKNIGTFKIIKKKERLGRNPSTKEEFIICSRNSLSFVASKKILDNLNKN